MQGWGGRGQGPRVGWGCQTTGPPEAPSKETFQMRSLRVITGCQEGDISVPPSALSDTGCSPAPASCDVGMSRHGPHSRAAGDEGCGRLTPTTLNQWQQGNVVQEISWGWSLSLSPCGGLSHVHVRERPPAPFSVPAGACWGPLGTWPAPPHRREREDTQTQLWWPRHMGPKGTSQHSILQMLIIKTKTGGILELSTKNKEKHGKRRGGGIRRRGGSKYPHISNMSIFASSAQPPSLGVNIREWRKAGNGLSLGVWWSRDSGPPQALATETV